MTGRALTEADCDRAGRDAVRRTIDWLLAAVLTAAGIAWWGFLLMAAGLFAYTVFLACAAERAAEEAATVAGSAEEPR